MRSLYNPGNIVKAVLSPISSIFGGGDKEVAKPQVTTPQEDRAKQDEAARQKAAEERSAAAKRTGASQTLIAPSTDVALLGTKRKSLLGGAG